MPDEPAPTPVRDWRDEAGYSELDTLDRRGFAWEYLRRNPDYRRQQQSAGQAAARIVAGVSILRATAVTIPPIWGLRFRGITRHRCPFGKNLLG